MFHKRIRYVVAVAGFTAVAVPMAGRVLHAQEMKCYFKDCIVFDDGSRLCEVKEVPCPEQT